MRKPVAIVIAEDILPTYKLLVQTAEDEKRNGIINSKDQQLLKSIENKIIYLKMNPQAGIAIPKSQIAKKYLELYSVTNLWKLDLVNGWRLIYPDPTKRVPVN